MLEITTLTSAGTAIFAMNAAILTAARACAGGCGASTPTTAFSH